MASLGFHTIWWSQRDQTTLPVAGFRGKREGARPSLRPHFYCILLVKASHKASSKSRGVFRVGHLPLLVKVRKRRKERVDLVRQLVLSATLKLPCPMKWRPDGGSLPLKQHSGMVGIHTSRNTRLT